MALNDLLSGMQGNGSLNGALGSVDGGTLVSAFTNKPAARTLLRTGGLVAIGGLAWQAYSAYRIAQQTRGAISPPVIPRRQFAAVLDSGNEKPSLGLVLQAMIAAARADRHLSDMEQTQIWQRAMDLGATGAELAALTETMANPPSMDDLAHGAETLETRMVLYLASCMVLDEHGQSGQTYLRQFARRLRLPLSLVQVMDNQSDPEPVAA